MKLFKKIAIAIVSVSIFYGFFWIFGTALDTPGLGELIGLLIGSYIFGILINAFIVFMGFFGTWYKEIIENLNFFKEDTDKKKGISLHILNFFIGGLFIMLISLF